MDLHRLERDIAFHAEQLGQAEAALKAAYRARDAARKALLRDGFLPCEISCVADGTASAAEQASSFGGLRPAVRRRLIDQWLKLRCGR